MIIGKAVTGRYDNYLSYSTMIHIVILPLIVSEKVYKNRKAPAEMMPGRSFLDVLAVSGVCVFHGQIADFLMPVLIDQLDILHSEAI